MSDLVSVRASSIADLLDCPARWKAKHIDGLTMPKSAAAQLGTAVHAGTAAYDKARLPGGSPITIDDAASVLVDTIKSPEEEVDWSDLSSRSAEKTGLMLLSRYCVSIAPKQAYTAVEIECKRLEIPDLGIALTGTADRVKQRSEGKGVSDLKTGGRVVNAEGNVETKSHIVQIGTYELLAEHELGEPITAPAEIIGMQTVSPGRIGIGEIKNAREILVGTKDSPGVLEHISKIIKQGIFYGNPKSGLCSEKYCPAYKTCKWKG